MSISVVKVLYGSSYSTRFVGAKSVLRCALGYALILLMVSIQSYSMILRPS